MKEKQIKIGVIREGKIPPDERVPFGPVQCKEILEQFPCELLVKKSEVRRISGEAYLDQGIQVVDNVDDADVLFGVKEVPIDELIDGKTYFFFSHTIKEQPYNRDLLKAILDKNIRLIDYECLVDENDMRLLGFGRFAGIVGAYNGFRMMGLKTGQFSIRSALKCKDLNDLMTEVNNVKLDPIKICITGRGRVASGAIEVMDKLGIERIEVRDYLTKKFDHPVYTQLAVTDYSRRRDGREGAMLEFFKSPELYESDFKRFLPVTDYYIASHFWDSKAPHIFTSEDLKEENFNVKFISDISCDIDGPVPSTIRPSTIEDPYYGIDKQNRKEVLYTDSDALAVMAVDNLPCELPVDASVDFGKQLMKFVIPHLFNNDAEGILKRATIAENGALTERYRYLENYVNAG